MEKTGEMEILRTRLQRTGTWVDLPDVEVALAKKRVRSPFRHVEGAQERQQRGTGSRGGSRKPILPAECCEEEGDTVGFKANIFEPACN